jgi:hypothetical protein
MSPGAKLEGGIHLEASHRGATHSGKAMEFPGLVIKTEVLVPAISSGMEERNVSPVFLIPSVCGGGLVQVAGLAGESQIVESISTPGGARKNVLDLKGKVEHLFRRVAVLAPLPRSFCHRRMERVHVFTTGMD